MNTTSPKELETTEKTREGKSSPRLFYVGMALFMMAVVFLGFWPTYFGSVFLGQEPVEWGGMAIAWPTHLHAAVFVGWMVLLLAQTTLIARGETRSHMRLGQYIAGFGLLVILVGVLMTVLQWQAAVSADFVTWSKAPLRLSHSWIGISQFALLLGLGYAYRSRPEVHKRYMLFATIVIVQAANSRMRLHIGEWSNEIMTVAIVAPLWAYDLYTEGGIHPATLIGTGIAGLYFVIPPLLW